MLQIQTEYIFAVFACYFYSTWQRFAYIPLKRERSQTQTDFVFSMSLQNIQDAHIKGIYCLFPSTIHNKGDLDLRTRNFKLPLKIRCGQ